MDEKQLNHDPEELAPDPVDDLLQEKKPASSGKGIALLALLLSVAAIGVTGWQWWQARVSAPGDATQVESLNLLQDRQQQLERSVAALESEFEAARASLDSADLSLATERLQAAENQLVSLRGQSAEDAASVDAMQGSVRSLEQRISATESSLVSVATSNQNSSLELEMAEIDFLLRAANERLQLFTDPVAADLALQAADVQVEALNDPMLLSVRQLIAESRQELATVPRIDRVKLSARLTKLQSNVPALPFRGEVRQQEETELPEDAGWWATFKHTLASLVTVRRRVPEEESLLSLEDKDYLRQGLWLQLESARLALMRNDADVYSASLDRVSDTVDQFFHNGSSDVQALLLEISALKQVEIAPVMPDISAPWTKLRQLRDSRRLLQSATPLKAEEAAREPEPAALEEAVDEEIPDSTGEPGEGEGAG